MARTRRAEKEKKTKKINYEPARLHDLVGLGDSAGVDALVLSKDHSDLGKAEARVLIAWDRGPARPDADGFVKFGRVKLGDDFDRHREHDPFDILLILRREVWDSFDTDRKRAEIDNLLCRVSTRVQADGEIWEDDKGRSVFRKRRPVEVFPENVARYGFHQQPKLADCLDLFNDKQRPLLAEAEKKEQAGKDKPKRARRFSEPANAPEEPAAAAETNGHANGSAADWRSLGIGDTLEVPLPIVDALTKADVNTLGDLEAYEQEHGAIGLADIPGMGSEKAELLRDLFWRYRNAHPEVAETAAT